MLFDYAHFCSAGSNVPTSEKALDGQGKVMFHFLVRRVPSFNASATKHVLFLSFYKANLVYLRQTVYCGIVRECFEKKEKFLFSWRRRWVKGMCLRIRIHELPDRNAQKRGSQTRR